MVENANSLKLNCVLSLITDYDKLKCRLPGPAVTNAAMTKMIDKQQIWAISKNSKNFRHHSSTLVLKNNGSHLFHFLPLVGTNVSGHVP